jgi:hypothetical protein
MGGNYLPPPSHSSHALPPPSPAILGVLGPQIYMVYLSIPPTVFHLIHRLRRAETARRGPIHLLYKPCVFPLGGGGGWVGAVYLLGGGVGDRAQDSHLIANKKSCHCPLQELSEFLPALHLNGRDFPTSPVLTCCPGRNKLKNEG